MAKAFKISAITLSGLVVMTSFQNCAPADFEMDPSRMASVGDDGNTGYDDDGDNGDIDDNVDVIVKACEGARQTRTLQVNFGNPRNPSDASKTCQFGKNGNLEQRNNYMQARVEQDFNFQVPQGAKICEIEMNFPVQKFRFDDMFFLSLNGIVLASSSPVDRYTQSVNGVYPYDWMQIRGNSFNNDNNYQYCFGEREGLASCDWPKTEQQGNIKMDFAPSIFHRIAAEDLNRTLHTLKMTTTGDDDANIDCQHDPVSFELRVQYAF